MPDRQQKGAKECTRGEKKKKKTAEAASLGNLWHFVHPWRESKEHCRLKGLLLLGLFTPLMSFSPPVTSLQCLIIVTYRSPWAMAKKWTGLHQTKSSIVSVV